MEHITLADLTNLLLIVDECVKRSAFQPSEIEAVGGVRNKLAAFVQHMAAEAEAAEEETTDAPEAEVASES